MRWVRAVGLLRTLPGSLDRNGRKNQDKYEKKNELGNAHVELRKVRATKHNFTLTMPNPECKQTLGPYRVVTLSLTFPGSINIMVLRTDGNHVIDSQCFTALLSSPANLW